MTSVDAYAASQQVREAAAVALGAGAGGAAWEAAGFRVQSAPEPGSEALPEAGGSGLAYRVLPAGGALEAFWAGDPAEAPEALSVPASASVQGVEMSVEALAEGAFEGCSGIQRAELPATLRSIGSRAFAGCSQLSRVSLPAGLVTIGDSAFEGCSQLAQLQLPDGLASIGDRAFAGTALPALSLPASVSYVGARAFDGCSQLKEIAVLGASCEPASAVLAGASGTVVYLPEGAPAWVPGLAASGNSVERYALSLPPDTLQVAADGSSTDLGVEAALPEGCRLEASYPASQLSVAVDGTDVLAKAYSAGSAEVAVSIVTEGGLDLARAARQVDAAPAAGAGAPERLPAFAGAEAGAAGEAAEEHHEGAGSAQPMEGEEGVQSGTSTDNEQVFDSTETVAPSEEHHDGAGTPEQMEGAGNAKGSESDAGNVTEDPSTVTDEGQLNESLPIEMGAQTAATMSLRAQAAVDNAIATYGNMAGQQALNATELSDADVIETGTFPTAAAATRRLTWTFYSNGLLEFATLGENPLTLNTPYTGSTGYTTLPWYKYHNQVLATRVQTGSNIVWGRSATMDHFFYGYTRLQVVDMTGFNTIAAGNMSYMFADCPALQRVTFGSTFGIDQVNDMSYMFANASSLKEIDFTGIPTTTSIATTMAHMFDGCSSLEHMRLPTNLNFTRMSSLEAMFNGCSSLQEFSFPSAFNAQAVTSTASLFNGCHSLKYVSLSTFNTPQLTNMNSMFKDCYALTSLDMTPFVVNGDGRENQSSTYLGVNNMASLFQNCVSLTEVDLHTWKLRTLTDSKVVSTGQVNGQDMFNGCSNLVTVYVGTDWNQTSFATTATTMFAGCTSIKGAGGVTYDTAQQAYTMANFTTGYMSAMCHFAHQDDEGVYWTLNGEGNLTLTAANGTAGSLESFGATASTFDGVPPWFGCAINIRTFTV